MAALVLDTHTVLWYLAADARLSDNAREALLAATEARDALVVPAICVVEATYLVEKGRLPALALERLRAALAAASPDFVVGPLDLRVAFTVARVSRDLIPDLPDRIIAATALALGLPLVTRDRRIRAAGIATIW